MSHDGQFYTTGRRGEKQEPSRSVWPRIWFLSSVCDYVNKLARKSGVKLSLHPFGRGLGCRQAGKVTAQVL